GARGATGGADVADHFLLRDALAHAHAGCDAREVAVDGLEAVGVAQLHHVAAGATPARARHHAVADGPDRRAGRRGVIHPAVLLVVLEDGVHPTAEAGADPGELER